jgi:hypothetical protein
MDERIEQELALLRRYYEQVEYVPEGRWVRIWPVMTGSGWSEDPVAAAFQIPSGFPGAPPYGFYVPAGLLHHGKQPQNYQPEAPSQLPFEGRWAMFSWAQDGSWRATSDLVSGSNLFNWSRSFRDRFAEGA